jgi:hypothetical protein
MALEEKDQSIKRLENEVLSLQSALEEEAERRRTMVALLQQLKEVTSTYAVGAQPHQEMNFTLAWWKIPLKDFLCGAVSGFAGKIVEFPFDTIKVKMQTQGTKGEYRSSMECFRKVLGRSGVSGLYQGLPIPLAGTMLETSILFTSMGQAKAMLTKDNPGRELDMPEVLAAGGAAGLSVAFILTPVELVKCRMQSQPMPANPFGTADAAAAGRKVAASASKEAPQIYKVFVLLCALQLSKTSHVCLFLLFPCRIHLIVLYNLFVKRALGCCSKGLQPR